MELVYMQDTIRKKAMKKTYRITYRLMHALFHLKTVIIPRDRYRPEGRYQSRDNSRPDMEEGMH